MLSQIKPLRQNAYEAAQQAVMRAVGERLQRERFNRRTASHYPPAVIRALSMGCALFCCWQPLHHPLFACLSSARRLLVLLCPLI